uniref:VWFA domain-containing protein n=1 Tax=Thelazia callipaeda TaxID=103827 RepID=A0A0N5CY84_THECL
LLFAVKCKQKLLDVIILFDTNVQSIDDIIVQQKRVADIIQSLHKISTNNTALYSIIAFHKRPFILSSLVSTFATKPEKVLKTIKTLRIRVRSDSSPASALDLAAAQFTDYGRPDSTKLVILAHNGISSDLIPETLEAKNRLENLRAIIFAVTSTKEPNMPALIGYTSNRHHVYANASDRNRFLVELEKVIGSCRYFLQGTKINTINQENSLGLKIGPKMAADLEQNLSSESECKANKVDIVIILDSSGSVYSTFDDERDLARNLIQLLKLKSFENGQIQVLHTLLISSDFILFLLMSLVRFSSSAEILIPSKLNRTREEIIELLKSVKFTGGGTRIANAVELALEDLSQWRRNDAIQIIILISDGNGQEFWHVAQLAGKKLQNSKAEIFALPTSRDYNLAELRLYTGDENRIYRGREEQYKFISKIASKINDCIDTDIIQFRGTNNSTSELSAIPDHSSASDFEPVIKTVNSTDQLRKEEENDNTLEISKIDGKKYEINSMSSHEFLNDSVDILLVIDRSPGSPSDLKNQVQLMTDLISQISEDSFKNDQYRVAILTFSTTARVDLKWNKVTNKTQLLQSLSSIDNYYYTSGGESSLVAAITLAHQYVIESRRPDAQLLIIVATNGSGKDVEQILSQVVRKLHKLPKTVIYAVSASNNYLFSQLEAITNEKWRVYVNGRVRQFIKDIGEVDIILLIDKSTSENEGFEVSKSLLEDLLQKIPDKDYGSKVRVSLITFTDHAEVEIELTNSTTKDDLLHALSSVKNEHSNASVSTAINAALSQIKLSSGSPRRRRIFVILTDGSSKDSIETAAITAAELETENIDVYIIPITPNYWKDELLLYVDDQNKILSAAIEPQKSIGNLLSTEGKRSKKDEVRNTDELFAEKVPVKPGQIDAEVHADVGVNRAVQNEVDYKFFNIDASPSKISAKIKRIPLSAFDNRIRVASISFTNKAKIDFGFDQFKTQKEILEALQSLTNVGGSTSLVSAVHLAVKEIEETSRKDARKMIVLLSDGNSQDHWNDLLKASSYLRSTDVTVYALAAGRDYYFRELELYAGNKWLVYVDDRVNRFLGDVESFVLECQTPSAPVESFSIQNAELFSIREESVAQGASHISSTSTCGDDLVDLLFIIDSSTSTQEEFYNQKAYAMNLIKMLPSKIFSNRLMIAVVSLDDTSEVKFGFENKYMQEDILYDLERLQRTDGHSSLASAVNTAMSELLSSRRPSSRVLVIIFTNGDDRDTWEITQHTSAKLNEINGGIYALSLSEVQNITQLTEYTKNESQVYVGDRVNTFLEVTSAILFAFSLKLNHFTDMRNVILNCDENEHKEKESLQVTNESLQVPLVPSSSKVNALSKSKIIPTEAAREMLQKQESQHSSSRDANNLVAIENLNNQLSRDEKPVDITGSSHDLISCTLSKMDLEIILDASTSRQEVFEHQRELALSLIERLPIAANETHVAIGINSFTSVPTLRQTLGLGRDKQMVRHAIEGIKYNGGSTLTAQAVELSVQDLERGKRPDAIQVVVLMNDGMSQDPWEKVVSASQLLKSTGAELFGVALGDMIDLRELKLYIGSENRIYRDNSTERFLTDIVSLLTNGQKCDTKSTMSGIDQLVSSTDLRNNICDTSDLDIIILFDNADETDNLSDPSISSNRYLLLDVLGSLPAQKDSLNKVNFLIITFSDKPRLIVGINDQQDRVSIFKKVESIVAETGKPSYARAISFATEKYNKEQRSNARRMLIIVGDGKADDTFEERTASLKQLHSISKLKTYAVDSGKVVDMEKLSEYTGSVDNIFSYDRNAEFARIILDAVERTECAPVILAIKPSPAVQMHALPTAMVRSTIANRTSNASIRRRELQNRKKDIASKVDLNFNSEQRLNEKVVARKQNTESTTSSVATTRAIARSVKIFPTTRKHAGMKSSVRKSVNKPNIASIKRKQTTNKDRKTVLKFESSNSDVASTSSSVTTTTTDVITTATITSHNMIHFKPGCKMDAMIIIDSSGSVEETFGREKELAEEIINRLQVGSEYTRVAIIKFAAKEKVRKIWSFNQPQEKQKILQVLREIPFSSGTTAIHSALIQAAAEYSSDKGARPGQAVPFGIIFTDGFGQKDTADAANFLRTLVPNMFAVAVSSQIILLSFSLLTVLCYFQHAINKAELIQIAGAKNRVLMDNNMDVLYNMLEKNTRTC